LGADDYVRKPYQPDELLARVRRAERKTRMSSSPVKTVLEVGPIRLDHDAYSVTLNGKPIPMSPKEFKLLGFFLREEGRVLTRQRIAESVWGTEHIPTSRTIDYHVLQVRKKLGRTGLWIKSLTGVGYRFEPD
jgi:DNA-binding response OmpR family regulator